MLLQHKALQFAGWRLFTIIFKYPTFKIAHLQSPREKHAECNKEQSPPGKQKRSGWWQTKHLPCLSDMRLLLLLFMLTNADKFLSSGSPWNRARLGPGTAEMEISGGGWSVGRDPTQQVDHLCLTKADRSLNPFAMLRKMCLLSFLRG